MRLPPAKKLGARKEQPFIRRPPHDGGRRCVRTPTTVSLHSAPDRRVVARRREGVLLGVSNLRRDPWPGAPAPGPPVRERATDRLRFVAACPVPPRSADTRRDFRIRRASP